ncbi:MAG: hypothetical protein DCC49_11725 [Acidobacteria bacterium]|nr:MAG: hypothetical protein DCC49_11725 [Acidobacteriota bacterium]
MGRNLESSVVVHKGATHRARPLTRPRTRPGHPAPPAPPTSASRPEPKRRLYLVVLVVALIVFGLTTAPVSRAPSARPTTEPALSPGSPGASDLLAKLPARFEANVGQAPDGVAYTLKATGYVASLSPDAIRFGLPEGQVAQDPHSHDGPEKSAASTARRAVVSMRFIGANPDLVIEAADPQEGISNYFLGNDPTRWHTNVGGFSKVYYRDLYPGIDMVIYDDSGQARYDFIVAPGADPSRIAFEFEGANGLSVSDSGDLVVPSPYGDLTHKTPFTYQGDSRREVASRFEIRDGATAGFGIGAYDNTRPLVIDPVLTYSSYLGGSGGDGGSVGAIDTDGAAYAKGTTKSANFPTASPFQGSNAGDADAFVTKINAAGSALVYSSYLGGADYDNGSDIAIDGDGNVYLAGITSSTDFPTASPFQATNGGATDAFIAKMNASGSALVYSSYLGGTAGDSGRSIAVDLSDTAYIAGTTSSTTFPTASPFQATFGGGFSDAFVAKVNATGSALVYSSYLGGSSDDSGPSIAVDSTGSSYLLGDTSSTDFPTVSPFQATNGGATDAFVAKMNAAGSALVYSSYLGGDEIDLAGAIAVDLTGNAYLTGSTQSSDFPTSSPFQGAVAGDYDAFVTKVNTAGSTLLFSSYLGGTLDDFGAGIDVDSAGTAYLTGQTISSDFPTVSPFQGANAGWNDAYIAKVNAAGSALVLSSYLGGSDEDAGLAIVAGPGGAAHIGGETGSSDFPTASPFQPSFGGSWNDAFVTKVTDNAAISGTFTGGMWGSVSVYSKADGSLASYFLITDPSGAWSAEVPASSCGSGGGYALLFLPPDSSLQSKWYNLKDNYLVADCVDAPSSGNDMTIPSAGGVVSGYVKDASTAADISGANVYAFKSSDGTYVGYGQTGSDGRYEMRLSSSDTYKLLVHAGPSYVNQWYSGAANFTEATAQAPPVTANFSVASAGVIDGYVKDGATAADLNGYPVYAFTTTGTFVAYGVTDRGYGQGRYRIQVNPGQSYKLKSTGGSYTTQWYSGASSFSSSTDNVAPFTANFSLS